MARQKKPPKKYGSTAEYTCQRVGCGATFTRNLRKIRPGTSLVYCPACEAILAQKAAKRRRPGVSQHAPAFHTIIVSQKAKPKGRRLSHAGEH